jgi:hypothetical protein
MALECCRNYLPIFLSLVYMVITSLVEPKIYNTLKTTLFDLSNRIKIVNFLSNHCFIFKISSVCGKRKEPELEPEPDPQFVISAPAWGGNLISAPRLRIYKLQHNTGNYQSHITNPHFIWESHSSKRIAIIIPGMPILIHCMRILAELPIH